MMTALPSSNSQMHKKRLYLYIFLSYIIGLGANVPLFFAYRTETAEDGHGFDGYVPWFHVRLYTRNQHISHLDNFFCRTLKHSGMHMATYSF